MVCLLKDEGWVSVIGMYAPSTPTDGAPPMLLDDKTFITFIEITSKEHIGTSTAVDNITVHVDDVK